MSHDDPSMAPSVGAVTDGLRDVRRRLRGHGGDLNVTSVRDDGGVELEFIGACRGCPALAFTFSAVVVPAARELPGVTAVTSRQTRFSPAIASRVAAIRDAGLTQQRHGEPSAHAA
jgi:Fe-S cluster biogenesis protein NfuA